MAEQDTDQPERWELTGWQLLAVRIAIVVVGIGLLVLFGAGS